VVPLRAPQQTWPEAQSDVPLHIAAASATPPLLLPLLLVLPPLELEVELPLSSLPPASPSVLAAGGLLELLQAMAKATAEMPEPAQRMILVFIENEPPDS
jgi:hypothetical protein